MTLDTLDYAKKLEAAGVPRLQAEAHAEAMRDTVAPHLATKADVAGVRQEIAAARTELKADIDTAVARLESRIDTGLARVEGKLTLVHWMLAFALAILVALFLRTLR